MKYIPSRTKKPTRPDDFSEVYHKGMRPQRRSYSGGGNTPKVSKRAALIFGRGLLFVIGSFWNSVISMLVISLVSKESTWLVYI